VLHVIIDIGYLYIESIIFDPGAQMTNQLSIPFKRTYALPLTDTVYNHIRSKRHNVHPEAFKWDLSKWEELRKAVANCSVHVNQAEAILE
jgi:programmed cell death 6-interacting protein